MTPVVSCHCDDNSYAAGPVLIETIIPRFYLKVAERSFRACFR